MKPNNSFSSSDTSVPGSPAHNGAKVNAPAADAAKWFGPWMLLIEQRTQRQPAAQPRRRAVSEAARVAPALAAHANS